VRNLSFTNVNTHVQFRWDWDIILYDTDGTLTGEIGATAVSSNNITLNNNRTRCASRSTFDKGLACSAQTNTWIRFAFNNLNLDRVVIANITNALGQMVISNKRAKRLTHPQGFMYALEARQGECCWHINREIY
jgi:hypothetical protein